MKKILLVAIVMVFGNTQFTKEQLCEAYHNGWSSGVIHTIQQTGCNTDSTMYASFKTLVFYENNDVTCEYDSIPFPRRVIPE